jgi:hypothetical protein
MSFISNKPEVHRTVPLDGKPWTEARGRMVVAPLLVGLGIYLWYKTPATWSSGGEAESLPMVLAVFAFIIAECLPHNVYTYLDLTDNQLVVATHYAGVTVRKNCRSFSDFSSIVVRHLCHSGEGEDTYTGSVGLKPSDGTPVLWAKSFPANADEVPPAAYEFARELQEITGLPLQHSLTGAKLLGN